MKKLNIVLAAVLLTTGAASSQEFARKFEVLGENELNLTTYEKDPEAEAVVLFDIGESIFFDTDEGYDIRFTRTRRIKVLNHAGIEYGEVSIPFYVDGYGSTETVASIEAYTYNLENGRVVKKTLEEESIFEEKINSNWRAKKFVFPAVKEGSIIEYKYVLETPFHFNLPDWTFQDRIPTVYSQYTASMIPFYEYAFLAQGITRFDDQKSVPGEITRTFGSVSEVYGQNVGSGFEFKDLVHTYTMKDVPAFKDESYITSREDYLMKLDFQLARFHSPRGGTKEIMSSWPELTKSLLEHNNFGKYLKKSRRPAKDIVESELELKGKSNLEKGKVIIKYVKANFNWNGRYSKYASKTPKEFVAQKTGNAADINLFLNALLNAADVEARPVILSTRDHGKIKVDYPFSHFFNYVVVLFESDKHTFLTDGTEDLVAFNGIPPRCINEKGLVVDEDEIIWVRLASNITSLDNKNITINIDPDALVANTMVSMQTTGFESYLYKNSYKDDTIKLKKQWQNNGFSSINKISTLNYERNAKPYIIGLQGEASIESIGNKLIVSPFLHFPIQENKLTQKKRSYPVDFIYAKTEQLKSVIKIPFGYKIFSLPDAYTLDNDLIAIKISFTQNATIINANAKYSFKKAIYQPNEYARIKHYLDTIVKKFNEQVVLEKI